MDSRVGWMLDVVAWLIVTGVWKWVIGVWIAVAVVGIPYSWWIGREAVKDRQWERMLRRVAERRIRG